jgi:hypothetical protein
MMRKQLKILYFLKIVSNTKLGAVFSIALSGCYRAVALAMAFLFNQAQAQSFALLCE